MDCDKDFNFITGHCVTFKGWQAMAEVGLDCRKGQLYWVVIRRVWWKEFTSHAPTYIQMSRNKRVLGHQLLPFVNCIHDIFGFVDPAIIHYNDRTGAWKRVHLVQEAMDEFVKLHCIVGAFNDIQSDDSIKSQRWEN